MSYYLKKIIEYGLYLLVFLLPIQTRWLIKPGELNEGYWEYGSVSLYGTDILLLALIVLFIITKFKIQNSKFKINYYWWFIAGLEIIIFISIFFASDKLVAVYRYGLFLLGVGLFWLVVSANYNKIKLFYSLLAGIFLQALIGIWQFLSQSTFSSKWLGIAKHNAYDLGTSVVETISSINGIAERWLRAYGGLDHPNVLGGLLVMGALLVVGVFVLNSKFKISNRFKSQNYLTFVSYLLLIFFTTALFFTFSRSAWLGLVAGIIVMLFILVIKKRLLEQRKLLEVILVLGIIVFILFIQYQDLVLTRVAADTRLENKSNIERVEYYEQARELIKEHWLFGVGIGNYSLAVQDELVNDKPSWYYQPVHNVFLLVWAEIGIIGFIFFIGLLICLFINILRSTNNDRWSNASLLTAIIIMFLFDHWWWSLHFGVLYFWLVLGILIRNNRRIN